MTGEPGFPNFRVQSSNLESNSRLYYFKILNEFFKNDKFMKYK